MFKVAAENELIFKSTLLSWLVQINFVQLFTHYYLSWCNLGTLSMKGSHQEHCANMGKNNTQFKDWQPQKPITLSRGT